MRTAASPPRGYLDGRFSRSTSSSTSRSSASLRIRAPTECATRSRNRGRDRRSGRTAAIRGRLPSRSRGGSRSPPEPLDVRRSRAGRVGSLPHAPILSPTPPRPPPRNTRGVAPVPTARPGPAGPQPWR